MIPAPFRMKGNAPVLDVTAAGQVGSFGPYGAGAETDVDESGQASTEPVSGRSPTSRRGREL